MNAETLHDALGHLPTDLLLPVEALRNAPRKRKIPWLRYGALAACLALALWGGGKLLPLAQKTAQNESIFYKADSVDSIQAPAEGAPLQENRTESDVELPGSTGEPDEFIYTQGPVRWYVGGDTGCGPVPGHKDGVEYPLIQVLRSQGELENWYAQYRGSYDLASFEAGYVGLDAQWFQTHDLLVVLLEETTDGICRHPTDLTRTEGGQWTLTLQRETHELENSPWLYFITLEKDLIGEADTITLILE